MNSDYKLSTPYSFTKVLIIENVAYTKRLLKKDFKDIGYFVLTALDGAEAIKKIEKYKPDIITFSHELSDMSIIPFLNKIKSISNAKILFISTRSNTDILIKEISAYINSVVSLPMEKEELINILNEI